MRGLTQDVEIRGASGETASWRPGLPPDTTTVIGVICAGDLAVHRDKIKQTLKRGIEQRPDSVWVCIEPKSDRLTHDLMISLGIEPVVLPMNDAWRYRGEDTIESAVLEPDSSLAVGPDSSIWIEPSGKEAPLSGGVQLKRDVGSTPTPARPSSYDFRRVWRDLEMLTLCDELVVFHKRSGNSPWRDRAASGLYADKLFVVELGKPKAKKAA